MEKGKNTHKQDKRKAQIGGGGNIGGLVLLGGALAVASFVATFAAHKGNRRPHANDNSRRQRRREERATQGLRFILQNSSPTFHAKPCCSSNGSTKIIEEQIDSSTLISTNCLILEENPSSEVNIRQENYNNGDQMILHTDDSNSKQDHIKLCDKVIINDSAEETPSLDVAIDAVKTNVEKISFLQSVEEKDNKDYDDDEEEKDKEEEAEKELLLEERTEDREEEDPIDAVRIPAEETLMHSVEQENGDDNTRKGSPLMEIIEVRKEQEAIDNAPRMTADIKLSEYSIEEEEEEADDDSAHNENDDDDNTESDEEFVMKKSEENSERRGSSSSGSNADEIWPAESVDELSQELKNTLINSQHSMAKTTKEDQNNKTEECDHLDNSKLNALESCRDINEITKDSTFLKKEDDGELTVRDNGPTCLRKWRTWVTRTFVMAFIVVLLFTYSHALIYFLDQDMWKLEQI